METSLPTRLKIQIRDHFSTETATLPTTIAKVSSTLGYPIVYDPEWAMLWSTLQPYYPDQATFIPAVASVLITFFEYFTLWLESEENEAAVECMLDELKPMGRLKFTLEAESKATTGRATAQWRKNDKVFVIVLPKARPSSSGTVYAGFASDFATLFTGTPLVLPKTGGSVSTQPPDDWSMLDSPEVVPVSSSRRHAAEGRSSAADDTLVDEALPELSALERPEALLNRPPYRLVVRQEGTGRVDIQGSHQGSLVLLEAYLKKWVRHSTTLHTRPPLVDIKLKESVFGLGLLYDALTIEATTQRGVIVNSALVLSFVENVLGYELVGNSALSGSVWEFVRKRGFK